MKMLILIVMLLCIGSLLGCSRFITEPIKNIVRQTYITISKIELVVQNISVENISQNIKKVELPLTLIKTALNLINDKINNPEVNVEIDKAIIAIDSILIIAKDANIDNINQIKTELEIYLIELKASIETAAKFLKVELPLINSVSTSNEDCIKELDKSTEDLLKLLD